MAFYAGTAILVLAVAWFIVLYGIAIQGMDKKINVSVPSKGEVQNITTIYNYEIKAPAVHVQQDDGNIIHATIDIGGIITAAIGASVSMVISKLLNRFWPDKKK